MTPSVITRVRCRVGVRRLTRRSKIQLHVVGSPHVEVLAHHLFEEDPSGNWPVEDLAACEFGLQHRDVVADALLPVAGRKRVRQPGQPLAQQRVDLLGRQAVGQPLHRLRVRAAQDAVVERFEPDAPFRQLALQILMTIDAKLRVVREVRTELEEERPEVEVLDQLLSVPASAFSPDRSALDDDACASRVTVTA